MYIHFFFFSFFNCKKNLKSAAHICFSTWCYFFISLITRIFHFIYISVAHIPAAFSQTISHLYLLYKNSCPHTATGCPWFSSILFVSSSSILFHLSCWNSFLNNQGFKSMNEVLFCSLIIYLQLQCWCLLPTSWVLYQCTAYKLQ